MSVAPIMVVQRKLVSGGPQVVTDSRICAYAVLKRLW